MPVIRINQFGGEMPSASSRAIPAGQARRAFNLLARVNEFRPLNKDVVKTTKAIELAAGRSFSEDGATLYRFSTDASGNPITDDTLGWVSALPSTNYVKGQINDSQTERVYISTLDGAQAPIVIDATGAQKPLGVPAPAAAPSVTHNVVNEYSVDEDTAARKSIPIALAAAAKTSLSTLAIGTAPTGLPSAGVAGWLAHGAAGVTGTLPSSALGDHNFLVPMTGSVATDPATQWLLSVEFGGKAVTYAASSFWAVPVTMQGVGYSVNQTTLANAIKAIVNPDTGTGQLVPDANATAAAANVASDFAQTASPQANDIAALEVAFNKLVKAVTDYGSNTVLAATTTNFYAATTPVNIATEISAAISNFANDLVAAEGAIVAAPVQGRTEASDGTPQWTTPTLTLASVFVGYANTNFVLAADGTKRISTEDLRTAITTNISGVIDSIGTGCSSDDKKVLKGMISKEIDPLISRLDTAIGPSHWVSYSGWPLSGSYSQTEVNANRTAAVVTAVANLRSAAHKVTSDYEAVVAKLADTIRTICDGEDGVLSAMPKPTTRLVDTRFYVATMVTSWGEESAPGPVSAMLNVDQNDTVAVTRPTELSDSAVVSTYMLTGWRLYRSNVGSAGTAFQLVADIPLATTSYTDSLDGAELQEVLPTTTWVVPPVNILPPNSSMSVEYSVNGSTSWHSTFVAADLYRRQRIGSGSWTVTRMYPFLRGLTGMANGIMAGFFDNTICFSEAFVPYAWPVEYQLTTKHAIVGMGSFGNSLFVGTKGIPYLFTGTDPSSMSPQELPGNQACVSARSIASFENGVLYASPDGICQADYGGVKVLTQGLFTKDDWKALKPESIIGVMHHGVYYFLYTNCSTTGAPIPALGMTSSSPNAAAFAALYTGLKQIIVDGNENLAREIYNSKQASYGFTDAQFAPYSGFTAAQIGEWKANTGFTTVLPVGTWPSHTVRSDGCYALDFVTGKLTEVDIQGTAFYVDIQTDTLYMLDGTDIKALFTDTTQKRTGEYWTGLIKLDKPAGFAWLQVDSVFTTAATIKWYGDGVLRYTSSVTTNEPVRLPAGIYREHQIMIESVDRITMVTMASSTQELQAS